VLFCFSAGSAIAQQQETAEQFVERAKKAIENDEWGRAKGGIKHALALKPNSPEANFIAAQVYQHEGARSLAIEALEKAVEGQPEYPAAHLLLARCLADDYKLDKAREEVNIAIAQGAPLFQAYRLLAEVDVTKADFESAVNSLETALRFSTDSYDLETATLRDQLAALREFARRFNGFFDVDPRLNQPDVVGPVLLNNPAPRVTEEARRLRIHGSVSMVVLITENGDVESVLVYRRLGHGLDEQATEAAHQLKFSAATRSGMPISCWKRVEIGFRIF